MNSGIISERYAKALFLLTEENGSSEQVFQQIRKILQDPKHNTSPGDMSEELIDFVSLVEKRGHRSALRMMFNIYMDFCLDSWGVKLARVTTAVPAPGLEPQLRELLSRSLGCEIIFEMQVKPELIGGFTIEVDKQILDASVKAQIETLRKQFVIQTHRIV